MAYKPHKIIREKTAIKKAQKEFWQVFLIEGCLFFLTSVLSVFSALKLNQLVNKGKIYLPKISFQDFFFSFSLFAFFVLLFVFYRKANKFKELIYKGVFVIICFWGGMVFLNLFAPVFGAIL